MQTVDRKDVEPMLLLNNFSFCFNHGEEYCMRCGYDFRDMNNYQVVDELDEEIAEDLNPERQSINAYRLGAEPAKADRSVYRCSKHRSDDCAQCFNWVVIISDEISDEKQIEKKKKKWQKVFDKNDHW